MKNKWKRGTENSFSNTTLVSFSEPTREADRAARSEWQGMKLKKHMLVTGLVSRCLQKENHSVILPPSANRIKLLDIKRPNYKIKRS